MNRMKLVEMRACNILLERAGIKFSFWLQFRTLLLTGFIIWFASKSVLHFQYISVIYSIQGESFFYNILSMCIGIITF